LTVKEKAVMLKDMYPKDQGGERTAASLGYESEGEPGEKMEMPAPLASKASDEGNHDYAALSAHNAKHGLPPCEPYPSNVTGSIEADNPTRSEGATNDMGKSS
jgi:hypothetical protein